MHEVHFLTFVTAGDRAGWIAPIELNEQQDGVLVVPLSRNGALFTKYHLHFSVFKGSGKFDESSAEMNAEGLESLAVSILGKRFGFRASASDSSLLSFPYIGELSHHDFSYKLCQIDPISDTDLDTLYENNHIILTGCEPETKYSGLSQLLASQPRQQRFF